MPCLPSGVPLKLSEKHPDYPALTFANYMFGGGSSSRLFNRIRKTEGLSYGVMSMVTSHPVFEDGSFLALAIAAPQNVTKVEATFKEELAKALKDGFTEQEIAEAKKGWLQERSMSRSQDGSLVKHPGGERVRGPHASLSAGSGEQGFGFDRRSKSSMRCDVTSTSKRSATSKREISRKLLLKPRRPEMPLIWLYPEPPCKIGVEP